MEDQKHSGSSGNDEMDYDDKMSSESDTSPEDSAESESENNLKIEEKEDSPDPKQESGSKHRGGRKKGQSYRTSYNTDTLKAAYHAVVEDGMAVYAASKKYGVPQSTLRDRVLGRISADVTTSGPPTIFTSEEEAGIASYIKLFSDIGYPLSRTKVRQIAGELASQLQRRGFTDGRILSLRWYYKLIERFPNMQSQTYANSRLQEIGYGYYKKLTEVFEECVVWDSPKRVFCLDEVCVRTEGAPLTMICRNVTKENPECAVVNNDGPHITLLGCFSASGKKVPPCLVFSQNCDSPSRKTISKIQYGAIVKYSTTGESTTQILKEYFELHFSQFVKIGPKGKKHLIFYNSNFVSIPLTLWFWGELNNVVFFPLPLKKEKCVVKPTVCLHGAYEMYEMEQKLFEEKNPGVKMSSTDVCKILCRPYSSLQASHFEQAFRSMSIFPLPDNNPGDLKLEKLIDDMKHESKPRKKRPKKKSVGLQVGEPSTRKKKPKAAPKSKAGITNRLTLKKVKMMTEKMRYPVPVDWTGIIAQSDIISMPVTSANHEGEEHEFDSNHTVSIRDSHSSHKVDSFENGVTLDSDTEEGMRVDGNQESYYVYIQGAECVSVGGADTENAPALVAEEVIIVNTAEV